MPAQPTLFGWLKGSANVKQERAKTKTAIAPHAAQRRGQDETACLKQHTDTAEFPRSTASQLEKQKRKAASMFMPQKLRQILPKRRRLEAQAKSQNMKQEHPRQSEVSQVFFLGSKHPAAIFALQNAQRSWLAAIKSECIYGFKSSQASEETSCKSRR